MDQKLPASFRETYTSPSDGNIAEMTVQQTLAQQMRINGYEIEGRKRLLGLDDGDIDALKICRPHVSERIDDIVQRFYSIQVRTPEIALVIGDVETLARLRRAMRGYILEMFEGQFDADYVNKRLRIGKVHMRIGVSPKLYTTALRILHDLLEDEIEVIAADDDTLKSKYRKALQKVLMFDIQLVFDTYIASLVAKVDAGRDEIERYAVSLEGQVMERTRQLEEMSRTDMLTELINQRGFHEHLHRECGAVERAGQPMSLAFIDLNDFKLINDKQGHQAGDNMLTEMARLVRSSIRETDIACRYGGDEFAVIMPRTSIAEAEVLARRIMTNRETANMEGLNLSIGLAEAPPGGNVSPEDVMKAADQAMYQAKVRARNEAGTYLEIAPPFEQNQAETTEMPRDNAASTDAKEPVTKAAMAAGAS